VKVARLSQVKNELSRYVEHVRRGGRVRILVRGVPAAELVPVMPAARMAHDEEALLKDLERRGLVRRGRGGVPPAILRGAVRPRRSGRPLSEIVIEERRSGR